MSGRFLILALLLVPASTASAANDDGAPLLVVLAETEHERDGVPVYRVDAEAAPVVKALSRGFSGRLLRLYRAEQRRRERDGGPPAEPAYLLLSDNQGGFPRFGFYLGDVDKRGAAYVDLHGSTPVSGRFGALDQLFPHELAHVIVHQLGGEPEDGGANQIHAVGVRTDPVIAFHEGFAEHFQIMAVDDPGADPATRGLATNDGERAWIDDRSRGYRRELEARWSPATRHRAGFPLWFGRFEQGLRYHAVRANAFARRPEIPDRLLERSDPWRAWLLENVGPAGPSSPPRGAAQMLAIEGVVSHLFWRWATDPELAGSRLDPEGYAEWGLQPDEVDALDNAYLKIFDAIRAFRPRDTRALVVGYRERFPADAARLDAIVSETLGGRSLPDGPELWLANAGFRVGTTVYDQFRRAPRVHTFDLNAASRVDLVSIPGVDVELAARISGDAPYASLAELANVDGVSPQLMETFRKMRAEMEALGSVDTEGAESEAVSLLWTILGSYLLRAAALMVAVGAIAVTVFRFVGGSGWTAAALASCGVAILGLPSAWILDAPGGLGALLVPVVLLGIPATAWRLFRSRRPDEAARAAAAWVLAALPGALLATPLF